jgi:hypothetical protein
MPYCLRGQQLTGRGNTKAAFFYFSGNTRPIVTYTSSQADINYWGMTYYHIGYNIGDTSGPAMASYDISLVSGPGECNSPEIITRYDCLNGVCVKSSAYVTQGVYASLSDCENNCSSNASNRCQAPNICVPPDYCPPGMVCLPVGEFSTIEGLATALENSACR